MNAQDLVAQIQNEGFAQQNPINYANNYISPSTSFRNLNNDSSAIDLAKQQFEQNYAWGAYKYHIDEGLANTEIRRRVIDLLKAGLNPYLAVGAFGGASTPNGGIPNNAASAVSGENKQKIDWKTFGAQTGMNIINGIIQSTISGLTMYQIQKNLIQARQDAYNRSREQQLNDMTKWSEENRGKPINYEQYKKYRDNKPKIDWQMGARGLMDGLVNAGDIAKSIIPMLIGIPNFNFGF